METGKEYTAVFSRRLQALISVFKESGEIKTDSEVAKAIGVSHSGLYNFVWGNTGIKTDKLIALARYFGVTTDYLLGLEDAPMGKVYDYKAICDSTGLPPNTVINLTSAKEAGMKDELLKVAGIIDSILILSGGYYADGKEEDAKLLSFKKKEAE